MELKPNDVIAYNSWTIKVFKQISDKGIIGQRWVKRSKRWTKSLSSYYIPWGYKLLTKEEVDKLEKDV